MLLSVLINKARGVSAGCFVLEGQADHLKPAGGHHLGHECSREPVVPETKSVVGLNENGFLVIGDTNVETVCYRGLLIGHDHGTNCGKVGHTVDGAGVACGIENFLVEDVNAVFSNELDGLARIDGELRFEIAKAPVEWVITDETGKLLTVLERLNEDRHGIAGEFSERLNLDFPSKKMVKLGWVCSRGPSDTHASKNPPDCADTPDNRLPTKPITRIYLLHSEGNDLVAALPKTLGSRERRKGYGDTISMLDEYSHRFFAKDTPSVRVGRDWRSVICGI